jgi:hypothetical protein
MGIDISEPNIEWECPTCESAFVVQPNNDGTLQFTVTERGIRAADGGLSSKPAKDSSAPRQAQREKKSKSKQVAGMFDKEYMCERFPDMQWVESVPSMNTINGCGFMPMGERDRDAQTNTYVTTVWLVIFFMPVSAFGSYRVAEISSGGGIYAVVGSARSSSWRFFGRVPMSTFNRTWNLLVFIAGASLATFVFWKV